MPQCQPRAAYDGSAVVIQFDGARLATRCDEGVLDLEDLSSSYSQVGATPELWRTMKTLLSEGITLLQAFFREVNQLVVHVQPSDRAKVCRTLGLRPTALSALAAV